MTDLPSHEEVEPIRQSLRMPVNDEEFSFEVKLEINAFGRPERDKKRITREIVRALHTAGLRGHANLDGRRIPLKEDPDELQDG